MPNPGVDICLRHGTSKDNRGISFCSLAYSLLFLSSIVSCPRRFLKMITPRTAALVATVVGTVQAATSCFILEGFLDDEQKTPVSFAQVTSNKAGAIRIEFVRDKLAATTFGIDDDGDVGNVLTDYTDGHPVANVPSANYASPVAFDFQVSLGDSKLPLDCGLDDSADLVCSAEDTPSVNVFYYCDGIVWISVPEFYHCPRLVLNAAEIRSCTLSPTTSSSMWSSTASLNSISSSTIVSTASFTATVTSVTTFRSSSSMYSSYYIVDPTVALSTRSGDLVSTTTSTHTKGCNQQSRRIDRQ